MTYGILGYDILLLLSVYYKMSRPIAISTSLIRKYTFGFWFWFWMHKHFSKNIINLHIKIEMGGIHLYGNKCIYFVIRVTAAKQHHKNVFALKICAIKELKLGERIMLRRPINDIYTSLSSHRIILYSLRINHIIWVEVASFWVGHYNIYFIFYNNRSVARTFVYKRSNGVF